jgi:hypothetical protein
VFTKKSRSGSRLKKERAKINRGQVFPVSQLDLLLGDRFDPGLWLFKTLLSMLMKWNSLCTLNISLLTGLRLGLRISLGLESIFVRCRSVAMFTFIETMT